jgi:catechol 2,3-dioxygenase-like lactoylglutathione lyase family enzyme
MKNNFLITILTLAILLMITGYTSLDRGKNDKRLTENREIQDKYIDPGLKKVIQVAIVVKDIETTSQKWAELLGMPVPEIRTTRPGHEVKEIYRGKPSEGQVKLTFFNLGQVVLELLQPVSPGTSWQEFLDTKGEGVQHLGFTVVDQVKASEELEKEGYPVFHRGRYDSDDGTYIYHDTQEALGVVIELLHSDPR